MLRVLLIALALAPAANASAVVGSSANSHAAHTPAAPVDEIVGSGSGSVFSSGADGTAVSDDPPDVSQLAPYFSQNITFLEAENMTSDQGWEPRQWAHGGNYFASTVNNVFMSRRMFLHAPANATSDTVAKATITVASTGEYMVMARYEALYRFETGFKITVTQHGERYTGSASATMNGNKLHHNSIEQGWGLRDCLCLLGKTLLSAIYGRRSNLKVWGQKGQGTATFNESGGKQCIQIKY